eukprot:TRINITY_DN731_c0_g4_i1.p1 TRINITY_DN731_c0_g4~~TRINITY_DN731_c0_g4_i1.p1  ORF type:complete len:147 (+),score=28.25 TRINITY_DN731_c0_g4_i1:260-700(+)
MLKIDKLSVLPSLVSFLFEAVTFSGCFESNEKIPNCVWKGYWFRDYNDVDDKKIADPPEPFCQVHYDVVVGQNFFELHFPEMKNDIKEADKKNHLNVGVFSLELWSTGSQPIAQAKLVADVKMKNEVLHKIIFVTSPPIDGVKMDT